MVFAEVVKRENGRKYKVNIPVEDKELAESILRAFLYEKVIYGFKVL